MCCGIFVWKLLDTSTYIPYISATLLLVPILCPFKDYNLKKYLKFVARIVYFEKGLYPITLPLQKSMFKQYVLSTTSDHIVTAACL